MKENYKKKKNVGKIPKKEMWRRIKEILKKFQNQN